MNINSPMFIFRLMGKLTFEQKQTNVPEAIDLGVAIFSGNRRPNAAQLMLMVSDGRGVFSKGVELVQQAVRRALTHGVFLVFLVIDNPSEVS